MFAIGIAFAQGTGVPQDEVAAVYWYQRAADLGFMEAQYWLANMISSGRGGISGSWTGAAPLYFKAAQQGHTDAQYMIGQMYTYGNGVAIDYEKAAEWYRLSSKVKPNPKSEFNLLTLIAEGKVKWRPGDPGKNAAKNAKKAKEAENAVKAEN